MRRYQYRPSVGMSLLMYAQIEALAAREGRSFEDMVRRLLAVELARRDEDARLAEARAGIAC